VQLLLMPSDGASGGLMMQMTSPDATGKFSYTGVRPGSYTINATSRTMNAGGDNAPRGGGAGASAAALPLWATADVNVNGQPVTGVTLNLQPGMTIGGSVVVSAVNADPPADLSRARVSLTPATSGGIMMNVPNAQVGADGKFSLTGITPGKYRVSASLSSPEANWTPKSAVVKGKDALDFPLEVLPNQELGDLVVTFTNQTQEVSGALQDASGRPAPDFTIVIFPADKALWTATRRIKTARPGTDGRFILANLPMGDYRLAAVTDLAPGDQNDPAFLEQLVSASVAIALKDGEKRIQDLKIGGQ
jgi:hypothetical protein